MPDLSMAADAIMKSILGPLRRGFIFLSKAKSRGNVRAWTQPVTFLGVAMLAAVYGILAFLIVTDRNEATAAAERRGDNLVRIIDQSYSQIFQSVDSNLMFLRRAYQQNPTLFNLSDWVRDASIRNNLAFNFVIADADGQAVNASRSVAATTLKGFPSLDVGDRDYFRHQANSIEDTLFISAPLKLKVSGKVAIVLTRRMTAPDGTFDGIVAALLDPIELGQMATGIDLGLGGTFGLLNHDGIILTRIINGKIDSSAIGRQSPPRAGIVRQAKHARTGHFWNTPGVIDDESRMVSYRVLGSFPMIAAVTELEAEMYRHSNERARIYWGIALLLTFAILAAIGWGAQREKKLMAATSEMEQTQEALRLSQERYRLVEDAVDDGIWDRNFVTRVAYRSPRWKAILGYDDDVDISDLTATFDALIHPDDRASVADAVRAHLKENKPYNLEFRLRHTNGDYRWVQSRGKAIRDASGRAVRMLGTVTDITERKQAAKLMEESRANLARAETMTRMGHFKYERDSERYTWSDGLYHMMGKSPASFTPTLNATLELVHPDDRPILQRYRHEVLAGFDVPPVTLRAIKNDGNMVYIELWSAPTRASDGTVTGMFGTSRDVTTRKQNEMTIKESNDSLARAEALALLGHYKFEKGSTAVTWSEGTYRIMGKSPEFFRPTLNGVLELFHRDDRAALAQYRHDVLAGLDPPRISLRVVKDDGQIAYVETWSTPIRAVDGSITGFFGTVQDVTERKQAGVLLEESLANLERAERLALLGHYKIEKETGRLTWSHGIYRIFRLSPASYTPTLDSALKIIHPEDRPRLTQYRRDAMEGRESPHVTLRAIRSDGQIIDVEYWSTPVRASDGTITGIFGTLQDITLRKQTEDALARANQELEARVSERSAELAAEMRRREEAQMTLGQMQKMEAVGQLTAGIAHDFNNLLAVIGGSLEFVDGAAARGLTAEPELIDAALRATRRGRELVRRLLAFSRQSPLRAEPTNIDQLVLDTLRLLQRTLGQGIDIVTQLGADAAVISVDRNQIANALLNLALNARDAMPDGGQLTIATKCQPVQSRNAKGSPRWPTGEEVCITISDTGAGMTEEVRSRAFEPFFTTKADGLGSGLGLSMVQGFVEQSGGHIEIYSAPGQGTTITITLPRIASPSQDDAVDAVTRTSKSGREKTVLLVEDDPDVRIVTAAQLKQLGYKVHAVANGMEAIDLIASPANIDITLTDIVLPGGFDGVELVKEAMRARPRMGVLCMSGYNPTQKHRKWLKVQNINFLEKPFSSARLAQALDAALPQ